MKYLNKKPKNDVYKKSLSTKSTDIIGTKNHTSPQKELTDSEISQRVLILKRFKQLLEQQRAKFQEYLQVLEAQEFEIENEDIEKIAQHAQLEKSVMAEISTLQKVIDPIENMYKSFARHGNFTHEVLETENLKKDLKNLQMNILVQNKRNRDKLQVHLINLRKQIAQLKSFPEQKNLFTNEDSASMIDLKV